MIDNPKPKWRRGFDTDLNNATMINGSILFAKDTGRLFIDIDDERTEVTDFVKLTESEILATLTPYQNFISQQIPDVYIIIIKDGKKLRRI